MMTMYSDDACVNGDDDILGDDERQRQQPARARITCAQLCVARCASAGRY